MIACGLFSAVLHHECLLPVGDLDEHCYPQSYLLKTGNGRAKRAEEMTLESWIAHHATLVGVRRMLSLGSEAQTKRVELVGFALTSREVLKRTFQIEVKARSARDPTAMSGSFNRTRQTAKSGMEGPSGVRDR